MECVETSIHVLGQLGWEVLMHPPYSLDLPPSDCDLSLSGQKNSSQERLAKIGCPSFLMASKTAHIHPELDHSKYAK